MAYLVPFVDPREHYRRYKSEFDAALTTTLAQGDLVMRRQLSEFEERLAAFVGVKHVVGVASGYHALHLSLVASGIGPGDEVITVAHTFLATISAIVHCGAAPVLVDVGDDHNMDVRAAAAAVTPRTKAILPVHLNGRVADMAAVMEIAARHGLLVIEDAAQALGATCDGRQAASFGRAGCLSFFPFKLMGCFGDGGAVTTDDPDLALAIRRLRYNGERRQAAPPARVDRASPAHRGALPRRVVRPRRSPVRAGRGCEIPRRVSELRHSHRAQRRAARIPARGGR